MKKVLMITGSLNRGGLEKVAIQIAKAFGKTECQFDFLIYEKSDRGFEKEIISLGFNIIEIPKPSNNYAKYYYNLKRIIKIHGPYDIVHSHVYFNSGIVMYAAKKCGVPICIAHSHSIKREKDNKLSRKVIYSILRRMLINYSDKCVACSFEAGINLFGYKHFQKNGIVILNPVDIEKYKFCEYDRDNIRNELNIKHNQIVLGQVSRLVKGKNQMFLIDVFEEFLKKKESILIIVGDGSEKNNLENYAKSKHIYKYTRFVGYREDIAALLSSMDVFVMTSSHEGLGIVLVEAMANGLPCVCNDKAIVKEIKNINLCFTENNFNKTKWINTIDSILKIERTNSDIDFQDFSINRFNALVRKIYQVG